MLIGIWLIAGVSASAHAANEPNPVRIEINALLFRLQASACEFNRNGSWYSAAEAKSHLLRKLRYLDRRKAVNSTERFIELGATRSSFSA